MFRRGKSKVKVSSVAYDAWGDETLQKKAEKKIRNAIHDGADPNNVDARYFTAMHWAAEYNWPALVHLLVNAERFPPCPNTKINLQQGLGGRTALHMAVARGHTEVTEALLINGANIEFIHEGMTAADIAIDNEDEDMYELLCSHHPELAEGDDSDDSDDDDYENGLRELRLAGGYDDSDCSGSDYPEEDEEEGEEEEEEEEEEEDAVAGENVPVFATTAKRKRGKLKRKDTLLQHGTFKK